MSVSPLSSIPKRPNRSGSHLARRSCSKIEVDFELRAPYRLERGQARSRPGFRCPQELFRSGMDGIKNRFECVDDVRSLRTNAVTWEACRSAWGTAAFRGSVRTALQHRADATGIGDHECAGAASGRATLGARAVLGRVGECDEVNNLQRANRVVRNRAVLSRFDALAAVCYFSGRLLRMATKRADPFAHADRTTLYALSPAEPPHAGTGTFFVARLHALDPDKFFVRAQHVLEIEPDGSPEPDVAVIASRDDYYSTRHPNGSDAALVIEVGDTERNPQEKMRDYMRDGRIPVAWRIDIPARCVEIWNPTDTEGPRSILRGDERFEFNGVVFTPKRTCYSPCGFANTINRAPIAFRSRASGRSSSRRSRRARRP